MAQSHGRVPSQMSLFIHIPARRDVTVFASTQFFVWETCRSIQKPMKCGSNSTKNYLESMENHLSSSEIFSKDRSAVDWTKKGNYKEYGSNSVTVKNYAKTREKEKWSNFMKSGILPPESSLSISMTMDISFPSIQSNARKVEDVRFTSTRILRSQSFYFAHFIQQISSENLISSSELVWRVGSVDSWSNTHDHGEIRREGQRSVISKVGTSRSGHDGTDT